jgi:predicted transcriptional regulator
LERSRAWIIKQAVGDWLAQEEERRKLSLEALSDVEAGHVVDHQRVRAWADSLTDDDPLPPPR